MKRSRSLYRVRAIDGHGLVRISLPAPSSISFPSVSKIFASIPGNGTVADPGFVVVRPGSGVIMIAPVSVCHHVSTIGHRPPPIFSWYHSHARGLIGSPTVPSSRSEERSCLAGCLTPHFVHARIAGGAV